MAGAVEDIQYMKTLCVVLPKQLTGVKLRANQLQPSKHCCKRLYAQQQWRQQPAAGMHCHEMHAIHM